MRVYSVDACQQDGTHACGVGAGKSSLLDIISGRRFGEGVEGQLRVDGAPMLPQDVRAMAGYVHQVRLHSLPHPRSLSLLGHAHGTVWVCTSMHQWTLALHHPSAGGHSPHVQGPLARACRTTCCPGLRQSGST